jgi:hypothetical protein
VLEGKGVVQWSKEEAHHHAERSMAWLHKTDVVDVLLFPQQGTIAAEANTPKYQKGKGSWVLSPAAGDQFNATYTSKLTAKLDLQQDAGHDTIAYELAKNKKSPSAWQKATPRFGAHKGGGVVEPTRYERVLNR